MAGAWRSISVALTANTTGYTTAMRRAAADTTSFERQSTASTKKASGAWAQHSRAASASATAVTDSSKKVSGAAGASAAAVADSSKKASGAWGQHGRAASAGAGVVTDSSKKVSGAAGAWATAVADSSKKASGAWTQHSRVLGAAALGISAGLAIAVKTAMDFDKQMSEVAAVSGATGKQMGLLRQQALDAGAATAFSASEAATAQAELLKAGVSTADVMGGALTGSLALAAAGSLDLGQAATISARAMNIFKLSGKDVGHIADVFAAGANKSAADVTGLGDALAQSGLVAQQAGFSLEETVGVLSAFADRALIGSDAGTSFKTMIQRLVPQSEEAAGLMRELGFSVFDANGNMISAAGVAQELRDSLAGMTQQQRLAAMSTLFGSDAIRGASVLYDLGASGVQTWTKAVDDNGAAAGTAGTKMDNLAGDVERLTGSIETALIGAGSSGSEALRGLASGAEDAVNAFGSLPEGAQSAAFGLATLSAGGLGAVAVIGSLLPKIAAAKQALTTLSQTKAGIAFTAPSKGILEALSHVRELGGGFRQLGSDAAAGSAKIKSSFAGIAKGMAPTAATAAAAYGIYSVTKALQDSGAEMEAWRAQLEADVDFTSAASVKAGLEEIDAKVEEMRGKTSAGGLFKSLVGDLSGYNLLVKQKIGVLDLKDSYDELGEARNAFTLSTMVAQGRLQGYADTLHMTVPEVRKLAEELGITDKELSTQEGWAKLKGEVTENRAALTGMARDAGLTGQAVTLAVENMSDESIELLKKHNEALGEGFGGFTDGLSVYETILARKTEAERAAAEATAAYTKDSGDSWEEYAGAVKVTMAELIMELSAQENAQREWQGNINLIAARGRQDVAMELAKMGPEGAQLAAAFATSTDAELKKGGDLWLKTMRDNGAMQGAAMQASTDNIAKIAAAGGKKTAGELARELGKSPAEVEMIATSVGLKLRPQMDLMSEIARSGGKKSAEQLSKELGVTPNAVAMIAASANIQLAVKGEDMKAIGKSAGKLTAEQLAKELGLGVAVVKWIAASYGITLKGAVDPFLRAFGAGPIRYMARGGYVDGPDVDRDVVPAMLMPGEVVISKVGVQKFGVDALLDINKGKIPVTWPGYATGGMVTGNTTGLNAEFMRRLGAWAGAVGAPYNVGSGYRSIPEQAVLFAAWLRGDPGQAQAAAPGESMHNFGVAADGNYWSGRNPGAFGLRYPMSFEPWHVEPNEARTWAGMMPDSGWGAAAPLPQPPDFSPWAELGRLATSTTRRAYEASVAGLAGMGGMGGAPGTLGRADLGGGLSADEAWIINRESGGRTTADNPTSTAFGLGQLLIANRQLYGGRLGVSPDTTDYDDQLAMFRMYVADRYGSAAAARRFWEINNHYAGGGLVDPTVRSYDMGGLLPPGLTLAHNGTGRPEPVGAPTVTVSPNVHVYIGDRELTDKINVVVDQRDDRRSRMARAL